MSGITKSLASTVSVSLVLLKIVSAYSPRARFYLNAVLYVFSLGVCSVWGVILSVVMNLVPGQRYNVNKMVARSFYGLAGSLIGYRLRVEGEQHLEQRPAIIVGNHQSVLDILVLGRIFPAHAVIMAKKELKLAPLLGQFMWLSGAVFIDRKSRKDAIGTMNAVGQHLKNHGVSLWMFPEGTRSHYAQPGLLPFKKGAFHLALQNNLPIVPVVCENYFDLYDSKTRFDPGEIRIGVLPPISTRGLTTDDTDSVMDTVRTQMLDKLNAFKRSGYRENGVLKDAPRVRM